jgi:hypothetical protein
MTMKNGKFYQIFSLVIGKAMWVSKAIAIFLCRKKGCKQEYEAFTMLIANRFCFSIIYAVGNEWES